MGTTHHSHLKATVAALLSPGKGILAATERLNALCQADAPAWKLTFLFGRGLQDATLTTWGGSSSNRVAAQAALRHRARCNSLAVQGKYSAAIKLEGP